tara:strand:+ start:1417 stop:1602 length:186 start_codon:yes stop_codon:yes gene_type:complete
MAIKATVNLIELDDRIKPITREFNNERHIYHFKNHAINYWPNIKGLDSVVDDKGNDITKDI